MSNLIDTTYFERLERLTEITRTARGIEANANGERLRIDVIREDIIRIKIAKGGAFDEEPTFAVSADVENSSAPFEIREDAAKIEIVTAKMTLSVGISVFTLAAHRPDGTIIFESYTDRSGADWAFASFNDEFAISRKCANEDGIYGLGEKTGRLNKRGNHFTLWNTDILAPDTTGEFQARSDKSDPRAAPTSIDFDPYYVSIPFFYHQNYRTGDMAGFFIDNGYRGDFEFQHKHQVKFRFRGGQYTEYLFAGPEMKDILSAYTWLTGRMQAPPLWALGYHQCRWYPYTHETLPALGDKMREYDIPCDVVWLDIDYMDGYRVFTWNTSMFPNISETLDTLRENKLRTITIVDPGVKYEPGYEVFDEAVERDVLCKTEGGAIYIGQVWPGKTAFPDFVTQEGRDWWGEKNAAHIQSGLAGIWNDMNEPATGHISPDAMRFGNGKYSHARYHNQFGMLMAMGTTDGLLAAMPDQRTFVLSRAGFSGIQRYAANWMGDNMSRWEHLWMSLPMAMGFGISGQPFVGADIGGFAEDTNAELLARWIQCGALTPFCRNHNVAGARDQYPWSFGDTVGNIYRESLRLRYRLLPTIYAAFLQASETGMPVQRPLILDFQDDPTVRDIDDQYLFGDHLLVAPVYTKGQTSRHVYLPEGNWYDWHTDENISGGRYIVAPTPMEYIPLYARGGSVIALWPEAPPSTMGYAPTSIELHIYVPEADGTYTSFLHEDDGQTFAFRDGAFTRTDFTLTRSGNRLTLEAGISGKGYPEFRRDSFDVVLHGTPATAVAIDGKSSPIANGRLQLNNSGQAFLLEAVLD